MYLSGAGSGRARSDPTHQHNARHVSSTNQTKSSHGTQNASSTSSSAYLSNAPGNAMDCESPGNSGQHPRGGAGVQMYMRPPQPAAAPGWGNEVLYERLSGGSSSGSNNGGAGSAGGSHRHHSSPAAPSLTPQGGAGVMPMSGSLQAPPPTLLTSQGLPHSLYVDPNSSSAVHVSAGVAQPGGGGGGMQPVDMLGLQPHHGLDPAVVVNSSGLNMPMASYPSQFTSYNPQTYITASGFPFALSGSGPGGIVTAGNEAAPVVARTTADHGDESPMMGVCVQQSPVASH